MSDYAWPDQGAPIWTSSYNILHDLDELSRGS